MNFDDLKSLVGELKSELSKFQISEIYGCAYNEMRSIDWANPEKMNLHSPFRQCAYIAALAMSIPQHPICQPLDKDAWKLICNKVNQIYSYYTKMNMPKEPSELTPEKHDQGGIASSSFILGICTATHASVDQVKEDIVELFGPFSSEIEKSIGISVSDLINVCNFIEKTLNERIQNGAVKAFQSWQLFRLEIDRGKDPEIAMARAKETMNEEIAANLIKMNVITFQELEAAFSTKIATSFVELLSQKRVEKHSDDVILPTEELSLATKPLADLEKGNYIVITGNHLLNSVQNNLYKCLDSLGMQEAYNKRKGKILEEQTLNLFKKFFGDEAKYYSSVCETSNGQNEHDLLIKYKNILLIVECKAKHIQKHFRDVDKAYLRIKNKFNTYIQEGYDQARNLEKLILSQKETPLYNRGGNIVCTIKSDNITRIEKIIVTYENEGILATKLSLLLNLDTGDNLPYCINIHDLKQIATYKSELKLTRKSFLEYLIQRKFVHEKIVNDDELDILGFFLDKASLKEIIEGDCDIFYIPPGFSKKFDEAYNKEKTPEVTPKNIGRNDPCYCGSGRKSKHCHGQ